jgi:hypothetical protein
MTDRERAENIAKNIDIMAEEIAKRSIPDNNESFREWSSYRLHERIKTHANSIILDYLIGDFQMIAALGAATGNDAIPTATSPEDAETAIAFAA